VGQQLLALQQRAMQSAQARTGRAAPHAE